ncbi:MAG: cell wall hydrolase [Phenylobacterium sp.]
MRQAALLAAPVLAVSLWACTPMPARDATSHPSQLASQGLSNRALLAQTSRLDPAIRALARRHDPGLHRPDLWGRPEGWASLDLRDVPDLGLSAAEGETAEDVNALRPFADLPIRPMRPFILTARTEDRTRAVECLTQAVYYEAAREPLKGQEAVAQVVLNRVRHPAYPKSVCGVVYQGAARATGCQFTFTCDGSMRFAPEPALWRRAQTVAKQALAGFVETDVGSATHYHAAYVAPYWAPTLVKMTQVGAHIFYRWTGPWGEPPAFVGRYAGREAVLTPAVLDGLDARTQGLLSPEKQGIPPARTVTLAVAGEVRTYTVADPTAAGGERTRVMGTIYAPRRRPTPEEIQQINERLAAIEHPAPPSAPDAGEAGVAASAASN